MKLAFQGAVAEADADLGPDALAVRPKTGRPLTVRYVDIDSARAADYRIRLVVHGLGELELFHLGTSFDGFCEELFDRRNAALAKELFLADRARIATFKGRMARAAAPAVEGRIDLYPRTLVFFPRWDDPFFLRIAELREARVDRDAYRIDVVAEDTVALSHLGMRFDDFVERLKRVRTSMERRCARMLESLVPGAGALASRMLDGQTIPRSGAGAVWPKLEALVCATDERRATYAHLARLATGEPWLGVKETGGDDLDELKDEPPAGAQHLLWYYVPVRDLSVHEVVSEEGHATYVWRAPVPAINRAWAMVQFRRAVLVEPEKHAAAYRRLPHLRAIAGALVGRAIHNDTWPQQIERLVRS